jgi:2-polyprenyl-6-methoxyphenol hydroxylase-like FAD-dependent oxidoreductase
MGGSVPRAFVPTDALVVGGGPVGLACSALIARSGARSLLVDRKRSVSYYPKARAISARSMEIFRQISVEAAIHRAMPPESTRNYAAASTLTSPDLRLAPFGLGSLEPTPLSPCIGSFCTQDRLEPILYDHLRRQAMATTLFDAELVSLEEREKYVLATVRSGEETLTVKARVIVGADGAQGTCAAMAGIESAELLRREARATIIFQAGLSRLIEPHRCVYLLLGEPGTPHYGTLSGVPLARNPDEWSVFVTCDPVLGEDLSNYPESYWVAVVRRITGLPDLAVRISGVALWWRSASVADAMARGRIALAGDSAHLMPPAGGLGMNTGLQDAHNLAWRVAAIGKGASLGLLREYDRERRPEVGRAVEAAARNDGLGSQVADLWARPQLGLTLGVAYTQGSFISDGEPVPARDYPYHDYAPSGRPGGRAPHAWLNEDRTISILDLFGGKFVVLTQSAVSPFLLAVHRMKQCDMPIEGYALEERFGGKALAEWRRIYGVQRAGAVLVRPDGVIAWRSRDGRGDLEAALHNILNPDPGASIPARCSRIRLGAS